MATAWFATAGCLLWLQVAPLPASAASSDSTDAIHLQARGFPPAQCSLWAPKGGAEGGSPGFDFWMRGKVSRQLYGCRLDADAKLRGQISVAARRSGRLTLLSEWTVSLNRDELVKYPWMTTVQTPSFACVTDGGGAPTPLPGDLFPLRARRRTAGGVGQWQKCVLVPADADASPFTAAVPLFTVAFRGGAPTIVCGVGAAGRSTVPAVQLVGLLGLPYTCFLATYLDFPALKGPPAGLVFQRQVLSKWTADPAAAAFLPTQCWPAYNSSDRAFDFDVVFDGKYAQRCRFQGDCPMCGQNMSSTQSSEVPFPSTQEPLSHDDATVRIVTVDKDLRSSPYKTKVPVPKQLLFERRLCTYHSLDENNNTVVHQVSCFG